MYNEDWFDEDDDDFQYQQPAKVKKSTIPNEWIWKLLMVQVSTRMGQVDQGQPELSKRLEAAGYLKTEGKGWVITTEGSQEIVFARQENRLRGI